MSSRKPRWRIRPDKGNELLLLFKKRRIPHHNIISMSFGIPATSGKRFLFEHQWTLQESNVRKLFACLNRFASWEPGSLTDGQEDLLQLSIEEFCEKEDPAPRAIKARSTNSSQVADALQNSISCMTVYLKVLHLRDRRHHSPVYRKDIPRLDTKVDVFDEFTMVSNLVYGVEQYQQRTRVRSKSGIVDLLPLFPAQDTYLKSSADSSTSRTFIEHIERTPSRVFQSVVTCVNGIQHGDERIDFMVPFSFRQVVIVLDLTSLPGADSRDIPINSMPEVNQIRLSGEGIETRKRLACVESVRGIYLIDSLRSDSLSNNVHIWHPARDQFAQDDWIEIKLPINWNLVVLGYPRSAKSRFARSQDLESPQSSS